MNKDNIRKWVDALRSGEYEQGKTFLNHQGKVAGIPKIKEPDKPVKYEDSEYTAPLKLFNWLGFLVGGITFMDDLYEMNDVGGNTFPEIADHIESYCGLKS